MSRLRLLALIACLLALAALLSGCGPQVPDVVGMNQAEAVRTLEDAGYKLGKVTAVATKDVPLGTVAQTKPAAGEKADEGSAIDVAVNFADGTKIVVPTVIGLEQVTAEGVAKTLGLTGMTVAEYSSEQPKGTVFQQSPASGSEVAAGSTLVMVVSNGPEPEKAQIPKVEGKKQADAEAAIKNAGFVPKVVQSYHSSVAKGVVIVQVPGGGSTARTGTEVQIVVSLGPGVGAVKVPSVAGKAEADAKSAISSAGLTPVILRDYSDTVAKGKVIAQFPDAGTTAAKGSQVAILVSLGTPSTSVEVPDVAGMPEADAVAALEAAGLVATVQPVPNAAAEPGRVFFQFPAATTQAAPGSGVLVVIAQ